MRKTILFLTLLFLAGCNKQPPPEVKVGPAGSDNDSPIIISDTTTIPTTKGTKGSQTMVEHVAPPGNPEHFHWDASTKSFLVHDKENNGNDTYRPACLVVPSHTPTIVPIPATAKNFQVLFRDAGTPKIKVLLMTWEDGAKDIRMSDGFAMPSTTDTTKITKPMQVKSFYWTIDGKDHLPLQASPGELVTVHYCPTGKNCILKGIDPCQ
jgi:hypothetical protein